MSPTSAWCVGWCLSAVWLFGAGAWTAPLGALPGGWALPLAVLMYFTGAPRGTVRRAPLWMIVVALPLFATAFVWPWPAAAIGPCLGVGLCAAAAAPRLVRRIALALLVVGGGLACAGAIELANRRFGAFVHELPALTPVFQFVLSALGATTSRPDAGLLLTDLDFAHRFTPTLEGLAVYPLLLLVAGALPALWTSAIDWRRFAWRALFACAVYAIARYALVFAWNLSTGDSGLIWRPIVVWSSFLPLVFVLGRLAGAHAKAPADAYDLGLRPRTFVPTAAAVMFGWLAWVPVDPGEVKAGRVVIDEHHSDWEWTDVEMDTRSYGQRTTYNYSSLAKHLDRYFQLHVNRAPLDDASLADVDVLMVKTPTEAYAPEEIAAIGRFVTRGGGLFLVGDHTNVFGTSHYLNEIGRDYGIEFIHDATYDNDFGGLSRYDAPAIGRHPAVAHLPPFLFATSCSLRGSPWLQPVQTGTALRTHPADYSQPSFFAEREAWRHYPFGLFHQAVATTHGRGRVLAFSDSTVWSNFFVYLPGKPELVLGMLGWLNHENSWLDLTALWSVLALVACAAAWRASRGAASPSRGLGDFVVPAVVVAAMWTPAVEAWTRARHPLPEPRVEFPEVYFHRADADYHLPITQLIDESKPTLLTFFNWAQRVDLVPRVSDSLATALEQGEAVVLARSRAALDADAVEQLDSYLRRGGRVLVLADDAALQPTAPLLARAGLRWNPSTAANGPAAGGTAERSTADTVQPKTALGTDRKTTAAAELKTVEWCAGGLTFDAARSDFAGSWSTVEGGTPLLVLDGNQVVIARVDFEGGGRLIVASLARLFPDEVIGHGNSEPTPSQLELYELEYALWRELLPRSAPAARGGVIEASAPLATPVR